MSGVEYASIQPGDMSPGVMNVDESGQPTNDAAANNNAPADEEEKKDVPVDRRQQVMQQLKATKELRKNMKRQLTGHVVTRWYRAPELILLEKDYG